MKTKFLDNVGDLFNDLYYIYKDKYNEEKDGLNTKNKKFFYYKKLRLTDDYQYGSEEEENEPPKKSAKDNMSNFNEWINRKETGINSEMFQGYFKHQIPSDMLKDLYRINDKKKEGKLVNVIKSGLSDLKNETKNMDEREKKLKNQMR